MKNRFIITISDIHGSKQYSVHEIIKKIIFFAVLIFILIGITTFLYIKFLNNSVESLKVETNQFREKVVKLKEESQSLKNENETLNTLKEKLLKHIEENRDKLSSMNEQLREVEEIIGIGPDRNASFDDRVEQARIHEEKKKQEIVENLHEALQKEKVTAIQKTLLLNSIPNGKPLNYRRIASNFGYRIHPVTHKNSFHAGLDLPAKLGTPIYAPASGVVVYASKKGAYGNFMLITHSFGFQTAYGHLSRFAVKSGEYVTKGQKIAYVGSTGRSTGPHLHYEIRYLTKWLDPKKFMFLDLDNINEISDKITQVNWNSILKQTERLITLSTKQSRKIDGSL